MLPRGQMRYVLDANVLIDAHELYYVSHICPGFWVFMEDKISRGELIITDKVREEIKYPDELVDWVSHASRGLLVPAQDQCTEPVYEKVIDWVKKNQQFLPGAKKNFAKGADGWLVAYAMVYGITVTTNEAYKQNKKNSVQIPNVCKEFGVQCMNKCDMLNNLKASFKLQHSGTP